MSLTPKQEAAKEALEKYGNQSAAARSLGISREAFRDRIKSGRIDVPEKKEEMPKPQVGAAKTLDDFRRAYDKDVIVPGKIQEAIQALGEGWVYEQEFTRIAGVSYADLGLYRDQFAAHVVIIKKDGRRAWAGTPELAEEMRRML